MANQLIDIRVDDDEVERAEILHDSVARIAGFPVFHQDQVLWDDTIVELTRPSAESGAMPEIAQVLWEPSEKTAFFFCKPGPRHQYKLVLNMLILLGARGVVRIDANKEEDILMVAYNRPLKIKKFLESLNCLKILS